TSPCLPSSLHLRLRTGHVRGEGRSRIVNELPVRVRFGFLEILVLSWKVSGLHGGALVAAIDALDASRPVPEDLPIWLTGHGIGIEFSEMPAGAGKPRVLQQRLEVGRIGSLGLVPGGTVIGFDGQPDTVS